MKKAVLATALAAMALTGCTQRVADLTVASTKNMNLNSNQFVIGHRVKGQDLKPVFIVPLGNPNVKEATDIAIEKDRCVVGLSDVAVEQGAFAFLVGAIWLDVEGNQVIDRSQPGCENWTIEDNPVIEEKKPKKTNPRFANRG